MKPKLNMDILTQREKELVNLALQGFTNKEIAEKLCISIVTVKSHFVHIFNKLGFLRGKTDLFVARIKQLEKMVKDKTNR